MSDLPPPPPPGGNLPPPPPPPPPPGGGFTPPPPPPPPPPGGAYIPGGGYVPPAPMGYMPGAMAYAGPRTDGLAIASLICGIVGIACFFTCLGVVLGPVAAIMGFISRQRVASSGGTLGGGGLALAGLILGVVDFVVSVIWVFYLIFGLSHNGTPTTG
jgi:hypothetical protein